MSPMQIHSYLAGADSLPQPPPGASTEYVAFELGADRIYHIPDSRGRRLLEGWASLRGIDWQDEEILPSSFAMGATEYLQKNPVLLWDHYRNIPIGTVLELSIEEQGLFIRAELFQPTEAEMAQLEKLNALQDGYQSYLLKANEVWWGIKSGRIRGLSVKGKTRRRASWSPELGKFVPQGVQTLIYEISVTPTQVHPGSRITGVNTLAKALIITKALPLNERRDDMSEKQKKALAAQQAYLEALRELGDGAELSEDLAEGHSDLVKAISFEAATPPTTPTAAPQEDVYAAISKAVLDAVAPLQQKINQLEGTPAPLRVRSSISPHTGSQPKPTGEAGVNVFEKALSVLARSKNGVADLGKGVHHGCDQYTAMKLVMARSQSKKNSIAINMFGPAERHLNGISLLPHEQDFFKQCAGQ